MPFDKNTSQIAITVPRFKLKKKGFVPFSGNTIDPYLVSIVIDSTVKVDPKLQLNTVPFPKIAVGQTLDLIGDGYVVYGPQNPGAFVAASIMVMKSDNDIRNVGAQIEAFLQSKVADLGIAAILIADPSIGSILAIIKELSEYIAQMLANQKDEEYFRTQGTYLRDEDVPFHINEEQISSNDYIDLTTKVIGLDSTDPNPPQPIPIPATTAMQNNNFKAYIKF